jgi:hypothetical protein
VTRSGGSALAWLAHPVTLGAALVLFVNDSVFKDAVPGWWTGKLSDLAGLVVAPAVLALLLPARFAFVVTAAGFVAVKSTAVGAQFASVVWTAVAGPSRVLADAGDLVALPALGSAGAWRPQTPTASRPRSGSPVPPPASPRRSSWCAARRAVRSARVHLRQSQEPPQ